MLSQYTTRDILVSAEMEAADAVVMDHDPYPPGFVFGVPVPWPQAAHPAEGESTGPTV